MASRGSRPIPVERHEDDPQEAKDAYLAEIPAGRWGTPADVAHAVQYFASEEAGFITGLYVVIVPLLGLIWRRRPGTAAWIGALTATVGLYLLSVSERMTVSLGDGLVLAYSMKGKTVKDAFELPLAEASEFVLGDYAQWYGIKGLPITPFDSWIIVMPLPDGRIYRIADHMGAQADMTRLHSVLSLVFIQRRGEYMHQLAAEKRKASCKEGSIGVPEAL